MQSQQPACYFEIKDQSSSPKPGISTALLEELVTLEDVKKNQEKIIRLITTCKSSQCLLWWLSEIHSKFFGNLKPQEKKNMLIRQKRQRDQLNPIQEIQLNLILNAFISPNRQRVAIDDLFRYFNINSMMELVLDETEKDNDWPDRAAALLTMRNNAGLTIFQQLCHVARAEEGGNDFLFRFLGAVTKSKQGAEQLLLALTLKDKKDRSGQRYLDEYWSSSSATNKKSLQIKNSLYKTNQDSVVELSSIITRSASELDRETDQSSVSDTSSNDKERKSSSSQVSELSNSNVDNKLQQAANSHKKTMKIFFTESLASHTQEDLLQLKHRVESAEKNKISPLHRLPHKTRFIYRMFSISSDNRLTREYVLGAINTRLKAFEDAHDEQSVRIHAQPAELQVHLYDSPIPGTRSGRIQYQ